MSEILKKLSVIQKNAVAGLACSIIALKDDGIFRTNDVLIDIVIESCFDGGWIGHRDAGYRHAYLASIVWTDINKNIEIVASFDAVTKYAFKNMILDIIGNNAKMAMAAAVIFKEIGMPTYTPAKQKEILREEKNVQEDGEMVADKLAYKARIVDIGAVRGEIYKKFRLISGDQNPVLVGTGFDVWEKEGVCPVNGLIGFVCPSSNDLTDEGTLCYLVCEINLVIPILEWGLEKISDFDYIEKRQNNKVLSYDKSGKLCAALRKMKKATWSSGAETQEDTDKQVVQFVATVQERFEQGKHYPPNYIKRLIRLTYTKWGSKLEIEVLGVASPKYAQFESDDGKILKYRDRFIPDVYYEIETEPAHNTIVRVSIFMPRNPCQYIEYRYS